MGAVNFVSTLSNINVINQILKMFIISLFTYHTAKRLINKAKYTLSKTIVDIIIIGSISILCALIKYSSNSINSMICLVCLLVILFCKQTKERVASSIIAVIISLSINYFIFFVAIILSYIPSLHLNITNDYVSLLIITIIYAFLIYRFLKIKKFKNGILFLPKSTTDSSIDILVLNLSVIILFSINTFINANMNLSMSLLPEILIIFFIMFTTIKKSLQLYYKQKLLVKELDETKEELSKKVKEIEDLEKENIEISKKSHTLVHKQRALEYKIEKIASKAEISTEEAAEVRDRLKEINKDMYTEKSTIKLDKTGIAKIDDMLEYMQEECKKNKIEFELQIKGNIHYMTNNLITIEDLETLIADHVKNAIIAINHTENINRSILVRLGEIDGIYSLYIYDSGVEFARETLENLGQKPSTTHAEEGGTGMGFMNTFDTLRKCEASLTINEFNEPSKDNYTKAIIIKFDKKNEFKIISYRENEVTVK